MSISPLEEYALRCAVQLASLKPSDHLSAARVAEREGISVEYASKILFLFRKANLVESVRGVNGGFKLTQPAKEVVLKQVFDALPTNRKIGHDFCDQFGGQSNNCVHLLCCSVRPFWNVLSAFFEELTSSLTLADLLESENLVQQKLKRMTSESLERFNRGSVG